MTQTSRPGLGYVGNPLDRAHERRADAAWLAGQLARRDGRCIVLAGERPLFLAHDNPGATALLPLAEAERLTPDGETLFLGFDAERRPVFAREGAPIDKDAVLEGRLDHRDLRAFALQGVVPAPEVAMAALARSLFAWHRSHSFCSACGQPSAMTFGGYRRDCGSCGAQHFPRTDPVTIMLITDGDRALLARSPRFLPGMYSAIAGFVEPGETIEEAVARETREETGLEIGRVTYHMSQPWPFPSSLMIACYAEATTTEIRIGDDELEDAMWVTRDELKAALRGEGTFGVPMPIAIAHHLVLGFVAA
jgi:NAD+ diphosphatase